MKRLILAIGLILVAGAAFAQPIPAQFTYVAKFVCGKTTGSEVAAFAFAPGAYFTSVNVRNASNINTIVQKRFSRGNLGETMGPISAFFPMPLQPARTAEVECRSIYLHLNVPVGTFIEGYVELRSQVELDVEGIYTLQSGSSVAMHIERAIRHP